MRHLVEIKWISPKLADPDVAEWKNKSGCRLGFRAVRKRHLGPCDLGATFAGVAPAVCWFWTVSEPDPELIWVAREPNTALSWVRGEPNPAFCWVTCGLDPELSWGTAGDDPNAEGLRTVWAPNTGLRFDSPQQFAVTDRLCFPKQPVAKNKKKILII